MASTTAGKVAGRLSARPVAFSEDHYRNVVRQHGYDTFELERFGFDLAGLSANELNVRWLCHHRGDDFLATPATSRIITTGFGMSGPPHMGTVSQILGINRLQAGGEHCQIVLGDLDAHNGKARSLTQTCELADQFASFSLRLGFNGTTGILRNQFDDIDCLRNLYLLGFYADDEDFGRAEEENHNYYAAMGIVDDKMTFRRKVSLALMASDFVTLGQTFDAVLVVLGLDEHKYVRFTREVTARLDTNTTLRAEFTLASIYSRLTSGFSGHPKMSKSIPESSIHVASTPDEIAARVLGDEARTPETSPAYQLICQMFRRPYEDCLALVRDCATASATWKKEKAALVEYLISVTELW